MKKLFAGVVALALGIGGAVGLGAMSASAHNQTVVLTCGVANVSLTNYDGPATVKVTLDGVVVHDTAPFGGIFHYNQPLTYNAETPSHTLTVEVVSTDPGYSFTKTLTSPDNCYTPPVTDLCPNLDGVQESIPDGYLLQEGNCVLPPPPVDVCPNLDGNQEELPDGYILEDGNCVIPPPPVVNTVCESIGNGGTSTDLADQWTDIDTRSAGHHEYIDGALHIWTDDASSNAKVSEAINTNFALKDTGALALNATANSGTIKPGLNLFVNFGSDGNGTLVYEDVYGQDLWLTSGSSAAVKANAPVIGGGNGSQWHGTIDQWLSVYPDAQVFGVGYALGSGVQGDWNLISVTFNCAEHFFDVVDVPEVPQAWDDVVVTPGEYGGAEPTCETPEVEWTRELTTVTTHYTYTLDVANGAYVVNEHVVVDDPVVTTDDVTETHSYDGECETTPPTETPTTPPTIPDENLAYTGSDASGIFLGGGIIVMLGLAVTLGTAAYRRRHEHS